MEQNDIYRASFYRDGYNDRTSGNQYRALPMSMRLADSPWNEYDKGWADAQKKIQSESVDDSRKFLSD